jgi:catechol 2,3-dioxygenase-like lactoylglutathione lyase family enzyme
MADVRRIVPNVSADDPDLGRAFFSGLLGLEVGMDLGWIATYISSVNPTAQVSVLRPEPLAAAMTVDVGDVDAVHRAAVAGGFRIEYPLTDEPWGVRRFFVSGPGGVIVNVMAHHRSQTSDAEPGAAADGAAR